MKKIILIILITSLAIVQAFCQTEGSRDTTFGVDGLGFTNIKSWNVVTAMALQPDGKILLAGYALKGNHSEFTLIRLMPNGSPDPDFGQNGISREYIGNLDNQAYAIALQPDGKILLAGYTNSSNTVLEDAVIMRFLSNGSLDATFNGNGKVIFDVSILDRFYALAIQSDGKIIAAGRSRISNKDNMLVTRFTANGLPDPIFSNDGYTLVEFATGHSLCTAISLQPDDKLILGGAAQAGTIRNFALARLTPIGTLDQTFGINGLRTTTLGVGALSGITAMVLQPDGKIMTAGPSIDLSPTPGYIGLVRYLANGLPDNSFGSSGKVRVIPTGKYCSAESILLRPNGEIIVAGRCGNNTGQFDMSLTQFLPNGTIDTGFGTNGTFLTDVSSQEEGAAATILQPDGKILVAGTVCSPTDSIAQIVVTRFIPSLSVGLINASNPIQSPLIYPNPITAGSATVKYELLQAAEVRFELFDTGGRLLQLLESGDRALGEQSESLVLPDNIVNGIYLLNIQTELGNTAVRIVVQRN